MGEWSVPAFSAAATVVAAVISALVARYVSRQSRAASGESTLVAFVGQIAARLDKVETRLEKSEAKATAYSDHIDTLEAHIWRQDPPPPPARPPV